MNVRSVRLSAGLVAPALFLLASGLIVISTISERLVTLQGLWAISGLAVVLVFSRLDWRSFIHQPWFVWGCYAAALLLLLIAVAFSPAIRNVKSWIVVGPFTFQPVEFAKIALILVYARYFSRRHLTIARWRHMLISFALFGAPAGLTLLQPDLGSASILFGIWFGLLLVSGLPRRRLLAAVAVFALLGAAAWQWALAPYQKERITGLFFPERTARTVTYSVIQSKIAIGSAGWWGKGYGQGTQTQLGFLPEPANDFILAAFIEEWGLVAGLLVIGTFVFLETRIIRAGLFAEDNVEAFICLGTGVMFAVHFLINAGSTVGLFPVVGVTFPFLSYGGSSLLTDIILLGMIHGIAKR